jgi:hypothetical protein
VLQIAQWIDQGALRVPMPDAALPDAALPDAMVDAN